MYSYTRTKLVKLVTKLFLSRLKIYSIKIGIYVLLIFAMQVSAKCINSSDVYFTTACPPNIIL